MNIESIITAVITLFAASIGGIISLALFLLNPNIKVKTKREELLFEAMDWTCSTLLNFITNPSQAFKKESTNDIRDIQNNIYLYGTKNEIKTLAHIKSNFFNMSERDMKNTYYSLAAFGLLLNLIRCETYGKGIISDSIFKTNIKDYADIKSILDNTYNQLVKELKLNNKYKII